MNFSEPINPIAKVSKMRRSANRRILDEEGVVYLQGFTDLLGGIDALGVCDDIENS
jgi:hypothetical protein